MFRIGERVKVVHDVSDLEDMICADKTGTVLSVGGSGDIIYVALDEPVTYEEEGSKPCVEWSFWEWDLLEFTDGFVAPINESEFCALFE